MDGKRFCGYRNRIVENVCRALWDVEYHMDLSRRLAEPGERFVMRTTPTMTRFRMAPFLRLEKGAPGELETNAASEASSYGRKRPLAAACLMPRSRLTRSVRRYLEDQRVPYAFHTSSQDAGSMEAWRYNSRGWGYLIWYAVKRPGPADCWAHHASFLPCPRIFPLAALAAARTGAIGAGLSLSGPVLRPDLALSALLLRMLRHDEPPLPAGQFPGGGRRLRPFPRPRPFGFSGAWGPFRRAVSSAPGDPVRARSFASQGEKDARECLNRLKSRTSDAV